LRCLDSIGVIKDYEDTTIDVKKEALDMSLWTLQDHPSVTILKRLFEKRFVGFRKGFAWGKQFLKEHHCYWRQHKKLLKNQCILHERFWHGTDAFVDKFLTFDPLF
jgi:hypothetical protein